MMWVADMVLSWEWVIRKGSGQIWPRVLPKRSIMGLTASSSHWWQWVKTARKHHLEELRGFEKEW